MSLGQKNNNKSNLDHARFRTRYKLTHFYSIGKAVLCRDRPSVRGRGRPEARCVGRITLAHKRAFVVVGGGGAPPEHGDVVLAVSLALLVDGSIASVGRATLVAHVALAESAAPLGHYVGRVHCAALVENLAFVGHALPEFVRVHRVVLAGNLAFVDHAPLELVGRRRRCPNLPGGLVGQAHSTREGTQGKQGKGREDGRDTQ